MKANYPTHVTLEVTTVCNIMPPCAMCAKHIDPRSGWVNQDASHFPKSLIPRIANLLAETEVLALYGVGEPLTCPYLFDFRAYVPAQCHIQFTSNGRLLNEANIDHIIANRVSLLDISLDASTPETYAKIRHGNFDETIEKIARLITERNRRGTIFPGVVLNMCLMRENIADLPGLVTLSKKLGANHCYAFHMNVGPEWKQAWFDYATQHCSLEPEKHDENVIQAFRTATDLGVSFEMRGLVTYKPGFTPPSYSISLPSTIRRQAPPIKLDSVCDLPWKHVIIYRDGNISNCCWQGGFIGSLYEQTFDEIWNGTTQRAIREKLLNKSFHANCSGNLLCPPRGRI